MQHSTAYFWKKSYNTFVLLYSCVCVLFCLSPQQWSRHKRIAHTVTPRTYNPTVLFAPSRVSCQACFLYNWGRSISSRYCYTAMGEYSGENKDEKWRAVEWGCLRETRLIFTYSLLSQGAQRSQCERLLLFPASPHFIPFIRLARLDSQRPSAA